MSTKSTLKYYRDDETGIGYHLYEDVLDDSGDVHLELVGVRFQAQSGTYGGEVDVTIPCEWAEALGLVPPDGDGHLELVGVQFQARAYDGGGAIDITIPRELAEALGLMKPEGGEQ